MQLARKGSATPAKVLAADRQARALEMRIKGMSLQAIASELGVADSTVHEAITRGMAKRVAPLAAEARALEEQRLDLVTSKAAEHLAGFEGELSVKAGALLVRASERRSKLLGLDAPEKVQVGVGAAFEFPKAMSGDEVRDILRRCLAVADDDECIRLQAVLDVIGGAQ